MPRTTKPSDSHWLSAQDAATLLGVQRSSLYSYVSRGLLQAGRQPGLRGSVYARADVLRLARQRQTVRNPARLAQSTLDWGQPVLDSAITQVADGQLYYQGQLATTLADAATLEQIACLLLEGNMPLAPYYQALTAIKNKALLPATPRTPSAALAAWFASDVEQDADEPTSAHHTHALLHHMLDVLCGLPVRGAAYYHDALSKSKPLRPLHGRLGRIWLVDDADQATLRQALVLCADHELNASSFAARVVASTGASLHACLGAGLAALTGPLHGGMTAVINTHWDDWHASHPHALAPGLAQLLQATHSGQTPNYCAGFGHPLYPAGDPRSLHLLALLPHNPQRDDLLAAVHTHTGLHPSLDYALVAIERSLQLPSGAAFALFALGRTAGWIAHTQEQRASGQLIRPRAHYTGTLPTDQAVRQAAPDRRVVRFR
ncbi:MAG: citrate synthase family protein [Comamonas sp.]